MLRVGQGERVVPKEIPLPKNQAGRLFPAPSPSRVRVPECRRVCQCSTRACSPSLPPLRLDAGKAGLARREEVLGIQDGEVSAGIKADRGSIPHYSR